MKKSKVIRTGRKYNLEIAGEYVSGTCIDSKSQVFQYLCPFMSKCNIAKLRTSWFGRSQIFEIAPKGLAVTSRQ